MSVRIQAEAHSDDHNIEVHFDAESWFEKATDDEILALARFDYGGDYPADDVAKSLSDKNTDLKRLFDYLEIINDDPSKGACKGFECHVDQEDAERWIKNHRPLLFVRITKEPADALQCIKDILEEHTIRGAVTTPEVVDKLTEFFRLEEVKNMFRRCSRV